MTRPEIVLVVARADNGVIGSQGAMPWHIPGDLKRFKRITLGKPVVMGRKTFESIGKPLPGRHNIVLTRQQGWRAEGVTVVANLAEAIAAAGASEIMIIGGAEIYREALPSATRIELTEIHASPDGDTHFSELDPARWRETFRESGPGYDFVTLERI